MQSHSSFLSILKFSVAITHTRVPHRPTTDFQDGFFLSSLIPNSLKGPRAGAVGLTSLFFFLLLFSSVWLIQFVTPSVLHAAAAPGLLADAPDLIVSSVTVSPTNPLTGTVGDIEIIIKNQGTAQAKGFSTMLYVDPAADGVGIIPTAATTNTTETFFDVPLLPGGIFTFTRTGHTFDRADPQIYVWVDPPWEDRVAEGNEQNNFYPQPAGQIHAITPATATVGTTITATLTVTGSELVDGVTMADFGAGITVSNLQVVSATEAIATLAMAGDTIAGPRYVRLLTNDEVAMGVNLFTVIAAATPEITGVTPDHGAPGTTIAVTIAATHTNFLTGTTTVDFGAGTAVQTITATGPSTLQVQLAISSDAVPGPRSVGVTNTVDTNVVALRLDNGFTVDSPGTRDATLTIVPSPTTFLVGRVRTFDIVVTPGTTPINGIQIHGQVDPQYLRLQEAISRTATLPQVMADPQIDRDTGEFSYAAGALNGEITTPFVALSLVVQAAQATPAEGTNIAFLDSFPATDITGPAGSILANATGATVHISADAGSATLVGAVDLQGRPKRPHAAWQVPLTLTLTDLENPELQEIRQRVTTDEEGKFTTTALPIGRYRLRIQGDHTLANTIEYVELLPGETAAYLGTLVEGDVEHERSANAITTVDFGMLSGALDSCAGDANFVPNADLDEVDDCVTMLDAALLVANFNMTGDRVFPTLDRVPAPIGTGLAATASLAFGTGDVITDSPVITGELQSNLTLPLYLNPGNGNNPVIAVTGHYTFDAAVLEVTAIDLSSNPPTLLLQNQVDNRNGRLHFQLILAPEDAIDTVQAIAQIKVRIKQTTMGSALQPVIDGSQAIAIVGTQGNAFDHADPVTLVSVANNPLDPTENVQYLPIIVK